MSVGILCSRSSRDVMNEQQTTSEPKRDMATMPLGWYRMDGWMDIMRVGVCVGMCKYWVIILDILAYGGAKCFRGMNPSLILLTSLILPVVLLFSAHQHPPTTHYSPCLQILVVNTHHNGPPRQYGPHHSSGSSPSNHRVHLTHSPTLSLYQNDRRP